MIGDYEIPKGSRLYFGKKARAKRELENRAVEILLSHGYEEIVTPLFSYHQDSKKEVIYFGDEANNQVAIRADSALEVVRLIVKRLGRTTPQRKWFYVQPIYHYPTKEFYQIGAESIACDNLPDQIKLAGSILTALGFKPLLQIGNIALLKEVEKLLDLDKSVLERHNLHLLFGSKESWVEPLIKLNNLADLPKVLEIVPPSLKAPLAKMGEIARLSGETNIALSPFYYADMSYYDEIYFRFVLDGKQLAMGGAYETGDGRACGFALYTDILLASFNKERS